MPSVGNTRRIPLRCKECSIGGNIATNAGGPRCLKYGVTRSYVLGLEVVLAGGEMLRTGGRLHKNKTGFDLVGLFTGSEGMLGVITEATLRLIPRPASRAMLAAIFPEFAMAAAAVQAILDAGHLPSALEITDSFTLAAARKGSVRSLPAGQRPPHRRDRRPPGRRRPPRWRNSISSYEHSAPPSSSAPRTRRPASASGNCAASFPTPCATPA